MSSQFRSSLVSRTHDFPLIRTTVFLSVAYVATHTTQPWNRKEPEDRSCSQPVLNLNSQFQKIHLFLEFNFPCLLFCILRRYTFAHLFLMLFFLCCAVSMTRINVCMRRMCTMHIAHVRLKYHNLYKIITFILTQICNKCNRLPKSVAIFLKRIFIF